ncbi:hypothetical protein KR222_011183, partial [Zaprionus bogoriensis]
KMSCCVWKTLAVLYACAVAVAMAELSLVPREEWKARTPSGELTAMELPLTRAIIAHTAGRGCSDDASCAEQVRNTQAYQMTRLKYSDISYHYLIGANGRVYVGRAASQQPALAVGYNVGSLAIGFLGNFDEQTPTPAALAAAQSLLAHAVADGQLSEQYLLLGHRQVSATKSPGDALYALLQQWPHWSEN